ncbi:endonuclease NucS domain-containing protein [Microbacterium sp. P07]|uniref:endonuclease NucS domain-containing protein n=1 Tax=Microbacterium sp. P07 TaxID=3366952 RepID=UPI003746195A
MTANENAIRDELANRLPLIEPGLEHVSNNFHLRNAHGADGFVDILARDSTGAFVVIELKKSTSTSRQALHEVGKYVDLLSRAKGLPPDRIRAIVISTEWHELLVPFSYYVHQSSFDLQGFVLELSDDGLTPIRTSRVSPLSRSTPRSLTASQRRIDGLPSAQLEQKWSEVKDRLNSLDVVDHVALHLSEEAGQGKMVVLALGTIAAETPREPMLEVLLADGDFDQDDLGAMPTEEVVLLGMEYEGLPLGVCYPEKVGALLGAHGWQIDDIERSGVFQDLELFPETDVRKACEGWTGGLSTQHFQGRARTSNSLQWAALRGSISLVIAESPGWVAPARLWLDELQAAGSQWDISVNVYDPNDMLQALLHGYRTMQWMELVPNFGMAVEAPDNRGFGLFGYLGWDGTEVDIVGGVRLAYKNIGEWGDLRAFDGQAEANARLLDSWHLSHVLAEKYAAQPVAMVLSAQNGLLGRAKGTQADLREGLLEAMSMKNFLQAHATQLDELVRYLRAHVHVDPGSATQMHAFNAATDSDWY